MSWSAWQQHAPKPPPSSRWGPVWSSVDTSSNVCVEIQNAPEACARKALSNIHGRVQGGADIQPQACISRGYTRQHYDAELLQSSYMFQTQSVTSPCYLNHPVYIIRYTP